jgi:hypothetical protein
LPDNIQKTLEENKDKMEKKVVYWIKIKLLKFLNQIIILKIQILMTI